MTRAELIEAMFAAADEARTTHLREDANDQMGALHAGIVAALAALEAHAAVVPREPTQEMRHAGGSARVYPSCYMGGPPPAAQRDAQRIYEAMLAASPFAPEKEARDE